LKLALTGARVRGKNIQYQLGSIDSAASDPLFDIPKLYRREIVIENYEGCTSSLCLTPDFLKFAPPHERGGVRSVAELQEASHYVCSGAFRQFLQLVERIAAQDGYSL
jgi:hypothetical protein